jgi:branched-chain amino acid aminotransferase
VSEPNLTRYDLYNADECFLTGTGAELIPITKIDGRVIGSGKPGPITRSLVQKYHAVTQVSGEVIRDSQPTTVAAAGRNYWGCPRHS